MQKTRTEKIRTRMHCSWKKKSCSLCYPTTPGCGCNPLRRFQRSKEHLKECADYLRCWIARGGGDRAESSSFQGTHAYVAYVLAKLAVTGGGTADRRGSPRTERTSALCRRPPPSEMRPAVAAAGSCAASWSVPWRLLPWPLGYREVRRCAARCSRRTGNVAQSG